MRTIYTAVMALMLSFNLSAMGANGVFMLPINCSELLPDNSPFLGFFKAVAKGTVGSNRGLSKRLFRVIALRERVAEHGGGVSGQNPIDVLIRKTMCFYREQKEPIKPVTYSDTKFISFLKSSMPDLEAKIEKAIFLTEFEREQKRNYEKQIARNRKLIRNMERQAAREAKSNYNKIANTAKRKARLQ